jgi:hypothetical protein
MIIGRLPACCWSASSLTGREKVFGHTTFKRNAQSKEDQFPFGGFSKKILALKIFSIYI